MKIAVLYLTLLSQSKMWSDWQQVQQVGSVEFMSETRIVEEWRRNPAVRVRRRWTLMVLAKAKERDASCADVPATQRKTGSSTKPRTRARAREGQRVPRLTKRTVPPSLKVIVATVARKVTSDKKVHAVDATRLRRWRKWKTQRRSMKQEFVVICPMMRTMELTPL